MKYSGSNTLSVGFRKKAIRCISEKIHSRFLWKCVMKVAASMGICHINAVVL